MEYQFPHICHINDVLPAIEGRKEFVVAERDHYIVVNYVVAMEDTFPPVDSNQDAIRRELRGIIFDKEGNLLARRLHKFFNVNEREETLVRNVDFSKPHVILEKLDGSMITPIWMGDHFRWGTKMGVTEVALGAEEFVATHPQYTQFATFCKNHGYTPIFEWCSRKQRIVVDYEVDRLVLVAVRKNESGYYLNYRWLQEYGGSMFELDLVKTYETDSIDRLIEETRGMEGVEGWIVRFDDGHMLKVKGEWYVRIHKTKDALNQEKNIIDMIVNEKIDDVKAFMLDADRVRVEKFERAFWEGVDMTVATLEVTIKSIVNHMSRKEFALKEYPDMYPTHRSIVFSCWEGRSVRDEVLNIIKKNLGTQTKVDSVRHLWGNVNWGYGSIDE